MPRQRYQDPKIQRNKNGSYYIRPWVDVIGETGLVRQKKTIVLGPETLGARNLTHPIVIDVSIVVHTIVHRTI